MTDVSGYLTGASEDPDAPSVIPDPPPAANAEPKMTPVEKIRAYQNGRLEFPDIAPPQSVDDSGEDTAAPENDTDESGPENGTTDSVPAKSRFGEGGILGLLHEHRKPAAVIGALILGGATLYFLGAGRSEKTGDQPVRQQLGAATSSQASPVADPITDAPIKPISAEASRTLCAEGSHPGMDAFSGEKNTAWVCQNMLGIVPGTTLTITLPSMTSVSELGGIPGFVGKDTDKTDAWPKYPLVSSVLWFFDSGEPVPQKFTPDPKSQTMKLDKPRYTTTLRLQVLETTQPTKTSGTATPTPGSPGIFGDLGKWGQSLGGTSSTAVPGPTPTSGAATPPATAFAMSSIKIIGHAAR